MTPAINTENHFRTLIIESPMATALYVGADMVIELANPAMLKIWQRDEHVIGKPLSVALPELEGQPFLDLLAQVYKTGTAYHAEAQKANLGTEGEMRSGYFNFTYKPLRNQDGHVYAILNTAIDITAQVEVTHQLEEDKERTDFILQSAGIGTWVVDLIAETVEWDERCSQIFDIPNEHKIDYNKTLGYIFPTDQAKVIKAVERAISAGSDGVYDIEYRTVGAVDKQVRWVRSRGRAYFNEAGLAYKFAGTVANITESVKLREARMQSELRASIALDAAGMGFWSVYALEDRVELDASCQKMYGWPHPQIKLSQLLSFIHPDDIAPIAAALKRTALDEELSGTRVIEYRLTRPDDGQERWIRLNGRATFNEEGKASYFTGTATDITEVKRKDAVLKNVEKRFQTAFDNAGLGIVMVGLDGKFMLVNKAFCTLTGYSDDELYNVKYIDITHPDDVAQNLQEIARLLNGEANTTQLHKRYVRKDGTPIWVNINSTRIADPDGPGIIFKVVQDITAEVLAREEQQKLLSMVENSADFIGISNTAGQLLYINPAGKKLVGLDLHKEVTDLKVSDLYPENQYAAIETQITPELLATGRWSGRINFRHFVTGESIPCHASGLRIDDPSTGQFIGRGFTMRDLRPWLEAQAAVYESETLLKNITAASPTALWMSDHEGQIIYVNDTWTRWTGQKENEGLNEGWVNALLPEDRMQAVKVFLNCLRSRTRYQHGFRLVKPGGGVRWCMAIGNPQYDNEGVFTGYVGSCTDITESKEFEQQKDDFLGMASHELKTPVTSIKAYTQVLEATFRKEGDLKKADMLHKMGNQVNRLTNLIGDLLDVTKINSGRLQFNQTRFDFNAMVKETVEDVQRTTDKHQIMERYEPAGYVHADRDRIGQVVINLITNAVKYSPGASQVIVSTRAENGQVILSVQDFGIGIPADKQQRVFEQFYRVSGNKEHTFPGLGLGLYISSEIIRREGGIMQVESVEGQGSTFSMSLSQEA